MNTLNRRYSHTSFYCCRLSSIKMVALCTLLSTLLVHGMYLLAITWPTPISRPDNGKHKPFQVSRLYSDSHMQNGRKKTEDFTSLSPPNVSAEEVQRVLSAPLVNNHNYQFLSLPKVQCQGRLVIAVTSAPLHTNLRAAIRRSWGRWANIPPSATSDYASDTEESASADDDTNDVATAQPINNSNISYRTRRHRQQSNSDDDSFTLVFFVGSVVGEDHVSRSLHLQLLNESLQYGDMVISGFTDTYSNLSLKTVSILKWADVFCPASGMFLVKCDDDSYINVPVMLRTVRDTDEQPRDNFGGHFVVGHPLFGTLPDRQRRSEKFVSFDDFRSDIYPPAVSGTAYGMRIDTAKLLYQVSLRTRIFRLENIYIIGICGSRVGVHVVADRRFSLSTHLFTCEQSRLASGHSYRPSEMHRVHSHLTDSKLCPATLIIG